MGSDKKINNKDKILRLARPVKKGLLHLLFSRILLVVALMAVQVMILVAFFVWLHDYLPHFTAIVTLFTIGMVIYLFNIEMDAEAKLTWMLIIAVIPVFGAELLLFTRTNAGHRKIKNRVAELIQETKEVLPQDKETALELEADGGGLDDLGKYVGRSGCFPICRNDEAVYYPSGEVYIDAICEEIAKAERYVFLEFFIIEEGQMWGRVLELLKEKVEQGVDVRVLYDGMCDIANLPSNYAKLLQKQGIKAKKFSPIRPVVSSHYNYRDHRKILVIDGKTAFTGGINLADEYMNAVVRFGYWKDAAVMVRGEAARSFTLMFLQMWNIDEKEADFTPLERVGKTDYVGISEKADAAAPGSLPEAGAAPADENAAGESDGFVMPYADCPLDNDKVGETVYMDMLYRANDYVHIMTPYLILDGELMAAFKYAAERGVDVRLILPGIPDKKAAYALAKTHYQELTASGVKIYEYTPGFVHAKVCVSDGKKAVVGTINFDYRSLYHHFECAVYLYRSRCIADIEKDFQKTQSACRAVTPETVRKESFFYKAAGWLLKFMAPLM